MEDKREIVARLKLLLKVTRAGSHIKDLLLNEEQNIVTILFTHGESQKVNIEADSGISIILDVVMTLF